jgi:hypothetical protein
MGLCRLARVLTSSSTTSHSSAGDKQLQRCRAPRLGPEQRQQHGQRAAAPERGLLGRSALGPGGE